MEKSKMKDPQLAKTMGAIAGGCFGIAFISGLTLFLSLAFAMSDVATGSRLDMDLSQVFPIPLVAIFLLSAAGLAAAIAILWKTEADEPNEKKTDQ